MNPLAKPQFPPLYDLGEGLLLCAPQPDDAEALYAVVDENRAHLRVWLPWVDGSREPCHTRAFLELDVQQRSRGETATYLVMEDGALAGAVGLHAIDRLNRSFLIGYWLAKSREGRGLITRSCRHLVTVAFEEYDMERAVVRCAVDNTRSAAVPKRLGFVLEGLERHGQWLNGKFVDLERYSRLRGDA